MVDLLYTPYKIRFTLTFVEIWSTEDGVRVDSSARVTLQRLITYRQRTFVHTHARITALLTLVSLLLQCCTLHRFIGSYCTRCSFTADLTRRNLHVLFQRAAARAAVDGRVYAGRCVH